MNLKSLRSNSDTAKHLRRFETEPGVYEELRQQPIVWLVPWGGRIVPLYIYLKLNNTIVSLTSTLLFLVTICLATCRLFQLWSDFCSHPSVCYYMTLH